MAGSNPTNTGEKAQAAQSFFVFVRDANTGQINSVVIPGSLQVGLAGNPSDLTLMGRLSIAATNYNVTNDNQGIIQAKNEDTIVGISLVNTPVTGRIKVKLPPGPRNGQVHFVKDMTETSDVVPIDVYPNTNQTIDGQAVKTLSDPSSSLALVYFNGNWRQLVAGLGSSGGSGASPDLSYVTINNEPSLTHERHLTGSANVLFTDGGAKGTASFDLSRILGSGAGVFTYATIQADAFGRVVAVSSGTPPSDVSASYLTALNDTQLPNHRQMSGGLGTTVTDRGAGSTFSFNVDPRVVPFLTGATFSGPVVFNGGLQGSLQKLITGDPYIIGQGSVFVTTGSQGQIILSGSGGGGPGPNAFAPYNAEFVLLSLTGTLPNGRLLSAGTGINIIDFGPLNLVQISVNNNVVATITGSRFTGAVTGALGIVATGAGPGQGFSGSLQLLSDGKTPYLIGAGGITVTTSSIGQVIVSASITNAVTSLTGAGGTSVSNVAGAYTVSSSAGADKYASYLLVTSDPSDPNARTLAAGSGITFNDGGAGGLFTIINTGGGGGGGDTVWFDGGNTAYTTSSISIDAKGRTVSQLGADVYFFVSGTIGLGAGVTGRQITLFGGDVYVSGSLFVTGGITGSITRVPSGQAYIVATGGINASTNSLGQIIISTNSGTLTGPNAWVDGGNQIKTTSSVNIGAGNVYAGNHGSDVYFYVSGTQGTVGGSSPFKSVFGGDVVVSGSLVVKGAPGITGSITQMPSGNPYIVGLGGTGVTTNSLGQIVISSSNVPSSIGIKVETQGTLLPGSSYSTVNFTGAGVTASDVSGIATVNIPGGQTVTGSAVTRQAKLTFLSAMVTSPQNSGSASTLGAVYFNPTIFNSTIDSIKFVFRALMAPVLGNGNAYVDLYDYSGIVTGTPQSVVGSVLTASNPSQLTLQQVDLSLILSGVTGSGIFLARGWSDPSGSNFINVGNVELDLEWA